MNKERVQHFLTTAPMTKGEFDELNAILVEADKQYNDGNPDLTDTDFDSLLFRAIKSDFAEHYEIPVLSKVSESENNKPKIEHQYNFLSLNKTKTIKDVEKFLSKFSSKKNELWYTDGFIVQTKEDGLTTVLYSGEDKVNKGNLTFASRGDGTVHSFATDNTSVLIGTLSNKVLNNIKNFKKLTVRGESIINDADFAELNKEGEYQNSRNLVSGTLSSLDPQVAIDRKVKTLFYSVENAEELGLESELDTIQTLINIFGVEGTTMPLTKEGKISDASNYKQALLNKEEVIEVVKGFDEVKRSCVGHTIDGLVIKPNYIKNRREIGFTSHHPRNQLAFKFPAEVATTTLKDVIWQIGKTGQVTPVAILEPVSLLGTTISRATLSNPGYIWERDIRIGDTVLLQRANDVIPQIIKPVLNFRDGTEKVVEIPAHTYFKLDSTLGGKVLFSTLVTDEQLLRRWQGFVSKSGVNIDALSIKTITTLVENHLIDLNDFTSLWSLKEEEFVAIDGLGSKQFAKLVEELEKAKKTPLTKLIASLGLPMIGKTLSKDIVKHFGTLTTLLEASDKEINELLVSFTESTPGIGTKKINAIKDSLLSEDTKAQLYKLEEIGFSLSETVKKVSTTSELAGKTVVVTGKTNIKRAELKELLELNSIKLTGSVSKNTDYLVTNDTESNSSKNKKARELSIPIISEDELLALLK